MATKTNGYTEGHARQNTSPSTEQANYNLKIVKTYDNIKSRAGRKEDSWEATEDSTEGYN